MSGKLLLIVSLALAGCGSNQGNTAESNVTGETGSQRDHQASLAVKSIEVTKFGNEGMMNGLRGVLVDLRVTGISDGFKNNFFGVVPQDAHGVPAVTRKSQFSAKCNPKVLFKETATDSPDRNDFSKSFYRLSDGTWYQGTRGGAFFQSGDTLYVSVATWDLERAARADNRVTLLKFAEVDAGKVTLETEFPLAVELMTLVRKEWFAFYWSVPKNVNGKPEGDASCYLLK